MVVRVLALAAALGLFLGLFGTVSADGRYQGMIVIDDTSCGDPSLEETWVVLEHGTLVSVFPTQATETAQLIGTGPVGGETCWVPAGSVVPYTSIPTSEPTEEPTTEPSIEPTKESIVLPTEVPTEEPSYNSEPIETVVPNQAQPVEDDMIADASNEDASEEVTFEQEQQEELTEQSTIPAQETQSPAVVSGTAVFVTTLPVTGTGSVDQTTFIDWVGLIAKILSVAAGITALVAIAIVLPGSIDGYRDYKEGYDTQMSRAFKRVLGSPGIDPRKSPKH
jgi:hypothetical protein